MRRGCGRDRDVQGAGLGFGLDQGECAAVRVAQQGSGAPVSQGEAPVRVMNQVGMPGGSG